MTTKLPPGKVQFINPTTGAPLAGGRVWHYTAGTSNLKDTYQDQAGIVLNTNPIVLDAYGQAIIWGKGTYRQVLLDSTGNQIWDQVTGSGISDAMDPVTGAASVAAAKTALGITSAWQAVIGNATLSGGMSTMGISAAMQPVVGAATLAAARTALGVSSVGLEVYNVKAYGAVGDGVTNDAAAINAAITACSAGIVYFPPGVYRVNSTIFMKPGVSLWGTSRLVSTLVAGANNVNIVGYVATGVLPTGFQIWNLGFGGGGFTGCYGIVLDGVDATKRLSIIDIQNCYFGTLAQGLYMNFCANVTISTCFSNTATAGFWVKMCADVTLMNCQAQAGAGYGFYVQGGAGAYDEGVKVLGCSTNGQAFGFFAQDQDWGQIVGCSFSTCIGLPMAFVNAKNWRVSQTDIAAAAVVPGLTTDANCSNIQLSENFVALNTVGFALQGQRLGVRGNHFVGNSGIDISLVNTTVATVTGNDCDSAGVPQSIVESGTANFSLITGNTVNGTIVLVGGSSSQANNLNY